MIARFHWLHARVFWKWWNHMEVVHHLIYYIMVHILIEWEKWSSTVVIQKYGPNLSWEPGFWSVLVLYLENNPPGPRFRLGFPAKWRFELSTSPVETGTVFGIHCLWGVSAPKHQRVTNQKKPWTAGVWRGKTHKKKKLWTMDSTLFKLVLFGSMPWRAIQESEMNFW